ncbi:hypothetical protein QAD02_023441 [Eretmocerus hayati]|uniref:Uncharacterized protein n=1 Tax=Eretmocerus hayati TaxID=131215 RepID=A0ACC2PW74_9HYME|nr:hypothetical protein QAD02_023441 [Eretmocerus hayati]
MAPSVEIFPDGVGETSWIPPDVRSSLVTMTQANAGGFTSGSVTQVHGTVTSDGVISVTENAETVTLSLSATDQSCSREGRLLPRNRAKGPVHPPCGGIAIRDRRLGGRPRYRGHARRVACGLVQDRRGSVGWYRRECGYLW